MPILILNKVKDGLDASMKKKAFAFLEKLQLDDKLPGLHIEPIKGSVDPRVRTGRVHDGYRCVMFKIDGASEPVYVLHGIWPHDEANKIAESVRLSMNPINGMPEIERVLDSYVAAAASATPEVLPAPEPVPIAAPAPAVEAAPSEDAVETPSPKTKAPTWPTDASAEAFHEELGINRELAQQALDAPTEEDLLTIVADARVEWQGEALLELATGTSVADVRTAYGLDKAIDLGHGSEDEKFLKSLEHPFVQASFHLIDDSEELRRIIEGGDLVAWRLFLHPEQRKYVDNDYHGPFRLSGGAGTGKTVVALHRAARLAGERTEARVLLTTFTRNLADDLASNIRALDESTTLQTHLESPGIHVRGLDQVVRSVLQTAGTDIDAAVAEVLGDSRSGVTSATPQDAWKEAIDDADADLPPEVATPAFFAAEYGLVVLPARITTETAYIRVRRKGRGVALDRTKRQQVWQVIERYRAIGRPMTAPTGRRRRRSPQPGWSSTSARSSIT
ncbi:UvrD-helicase domain-containing protein [Flexivirga oryzae]|uniref:UvrD-like helicase ATP-binding domain-containing protein n=1 Tax=Flexivirga oryzae TaxID=1794944 RepID=A0A839N7D4_9MICO|nr:UvrD-helicase domain-containing protein [Flexivirga oryzae]MBB2890651.1 hypothetical protein [Flexivirga oryzae]